MGLIILFNDCVCLAIIENWKDRRDFKEAIKETIKSKQKKKKKKIENSLKYKCLIELGK